MNFSILKKSKFISRVKSISLIVFIFFISAVPLFAQDDEPVDEPKTDEKKEILVIPKFMPSLRGYFKLPNAMGNYMFKKVFNGISNLEVSYVHPFAKSFFAGGGFQHAYYDINTYHIFEQLNGKMQSFMVHAEAGYQKYLNDKWYYMISLRAGYGVVAIRSSSCTALDAKVPQKAMLFNEGLFGLYLHGNDRMSYGVVVSYQLYHFEFSPEWVCLDNFAGYSKTDYTGLSQSFTIGFGFTCILGNMDE